MTNGTQTASAPTVLKKNVAPVDPVFRQIRDLVYKASGIFQADEKVYLLVDACGRRMKQLSVRNPREYFGICWPPKPPGTRNYDNC